MFCLTIFIRRRKFETLFLLLVILIILGGEAASGAGSSSIAFSLLSIIFLLFRSSFKKAPFPSGAFNSSLLFRRVSLGFPRKGFLIVFWVRKNIFFYSSQIPQDKEPLLLFWEGVAPPSGFPSYKIRVEVEEVIEIFRER